MTIEKIFASAFQNHQKNNLEVAENLYKEILKKNPNHFQSNFLLGTLSAQTKKFDIAKQLLNKATKIDPDNMDAHNNLGNVLKELREYQKAKSCYEKAIQIQPNYADAHNNLGIVFKESGEHQKAISCYEKAIQIQPNYANAHNNLGMLFQESGEHQKAISCYEKAIQVEPNNLASHWLSMNAFPIVYENLKEIDFYRKKFENSIEKINQLLDIQSQYTKKQIIDAMNSSTNFYLHYQGGNDLKLQIKYGKLIERLTQKIYPHFQQDIKINKSTESIKIGFVSPHFNDHTITKLFKNWIIKLNRNFFSIFVYYAGNKFDETTDLIKDHADNFFSHTHVDQLIDQIYKDKLDILVYFDIGMDPKIQILASLRLAPIQYNTFGHPVTSGLKNIDYFFSSELMEKKDSQKYYSEKLINLPGIGIDYDQIDISNIKKPNIEKKSNKIIFLNLQSLFKLLPQDDHIYLDILKKHPNCCFWFIHGLKNSISSVFKERIAKLFQNHNLSFNKYSIFHPRCTRDKYLGLIERSDIILDSLNWSGGNTSLEAISLNKPIVTCPSEYMKGRVTYSFLRKLNIEETIASSKKEYVEIAVKLAKDNNFRNSITKKIVNNKNNLFNDNKPIRFLEEVIRKKFLELK